MSSNSWCKNCKSSELIKESEKKNKKIPNISQNLSNQILFFTLLVPALILITFVSSLHIFVAKYLHDLRPYLVALTFGRERI